MLHRFFTCVAVATWLFAIPSLALAHAALETATPGPDAVISDVPDSLVGHFTQNLDPRIEETYMEVRDATGASIAKGGVDTDAADKRTVRVPLPMLAPGTYEVRWQTLSTEDGELDRDTYTFTVVPAASPTPRLTATPAFSVVGSPSASATPSSTGTPAASPPPGAETNADQVVVPIAGGLIALAGLGVWLLRRQASR